MEKYKESIFWKKSFDKKNDTFDGAREILQRSYEQLREKIKPILASIEHDTPELTIHDITHIDSLWIISSTIAGENYDLNPAEAFVLGCAFLIHDAAHSLYAYPGGTNEIMAYPEWKSICQQYSVDPNNIDKNNEIYNAIIFEFLRQLHPHRAKELLQVKWGNEYLLENDDLRNTYGHIIGQIAQSHWMYPHEIEKFRDQIISTPTLLSPASWKIDVLKIAILLRTADAAHIDSNRAPTFHMKLKNPTGASRDHWIFQNKMRSIACNPKNNELFITSAPFSSDEQEAWWLAYDTAKMINNELRAADKLLIDCRGPEFRLEARHFNSSETPELFARHVEVLDWHPIDASIKISNVEGMVEKFGGSKLYGENPKWALRELLQNSVDAVHACRSIGGLGDDEGYIEVSIEPCEDSYWLNVLDTGIGMSKFVLTDVLLDFGNSLWTSKKLKTEWNSLSGTTFEPIGQFGIGFFSIFMLGQLVQVTTRRHDAMKNEPICWTLKFDRNISSRPLLCESPETSRLKRSGTMVSVLIDKDTYQKLCFPLPAQNNNNSREYKPLSETCQYLAPALDIDLFFKNDGVRKKIVSVNDWRMLSTEELLSRLNPELDASTPSLSRPILDIYSSTKELIGRGRVEVGHPWSSPRGVGVVKGIFAGYVDCFAGIINCLPQFDLARQSATPQINMSELTTWAETHKNKLLESKVLAPNFSYILRAFGATPCYLPIVDSGEEQITYEELIVRIESSNEPICIHYGDILMEEDDDLAKSEFEKHFEKRDCVLLAPIPKKVEWLKKINGYIMSAEESFTSIFTSIAVNHWGDEIHIDYESICVGKVKDKNIYRSCFIVATDSDSFNSLIAH